MSALDDVRERLNVRIAELETENALLRAALDHYWQHTVCPCGARRESPRTHPHVLGCPVGKALARLG